MSETAGGDAFLTTRWSVVVAAGGESPAARLALGELCERYWPPLYAYLRRRGLQAADAQELVQSFFTRLLEKDDLRLADPKRGRFRAFLSTAIRNFAANESARARAKKRGGDERFLSLDFEGAEARLDPADPRTPEVAFEQEWARTLLEGVFEGLRSEYAKRGQEELFDAIAPWISGELPGSSRAELADRLGLTEGALKVALHRMRRRYRDRLHEEVLHTVADPDDVEEELGALRAVLAQKAPDSP